MHDLNVMRGHIYMQDVDDLKKQLESKTKELEAVKKAAIERTKQYNDNVKKLIRLLGRACKERDEAKDKLQKLLLQTNQALAPPLTAGTLSPQSPLITVDNTTAHGSPCSKNNHQADWAIIENLAKGRRRPQQGHLLTAVCEASQLLNSVAKTGSHSVLLPVPQTPPQVADALQVPATPIFVMLNINDQCMINCM
ncbi:hypothetical protein Cgig2_003984 [Carnegiea gigantea]|uniref:Uncharacterized protein n=1 Tax=Carnegiea gigantea TaxID=171969 RepID=A0A9Q1QEZ4_9CARY|nr:hypothetical protein Cgig2_003984 [Carnegiea gigantea]